MYVDPFLFSTNTKSKQKKNSSTYMVLLSLQTSKKGFEGYASKGSSHGSFLCDEGETRVWRLVHKSVLVKLFGFNVGGKNVHGYVWVGNNRSDYVTIQLVHVKTWRSMV